MITKYQSKRDGGVWYRVRVKDADGRCLPCEKFSNKRAAEDHELDLKGRVRAAVRDGFRTLREQQDAEKRARDEAEAKRKEAEVTFAELCKAFLKDHDGSRRSDHYPKELRRLLADLGTEQVRTWDQQRIKDYKRHLETTPIRSDVLPSPTTVRKSLSVLRTVLRFAVGNGTLTHDPSVGVAFPTAADHRVVYLTPDQVRAIEDAARPYLKPMIRVAVTTGMRLKEVGLLKHTDIDWTTGRIHVPPGKTKPRIIPMSPAAAEAIKSVKRRAISPYIFHGEDGKPIDTDPARRLISRHASEAARIAEVFDPKGNPAGFHVMRHTAASWMVQAGVPLFDVQTILGHSTPVLTQRYAHLAPDFGRGAVAAIDQRLGHQPVTKGEAEAVESVG